MELGELRKAKSSSVISVLSSSGKSSRKKLSVKVGKLVAGNCWWWLLDGKFSAACGVTDDEGAVVDVCAAVKVDEVRYDGIRVESIVKTLLCCCMTSPCCSTNFVSSLVTLLSSLVTSLLSLVTSLLSLVTSLLSLVTSLLSLVTSLLSLVTSGSVVICSMMIDNYIRN